MSREVKMIRASQGRKYGFAAIVGGSPAMLEAKAMLARVAVSPAATVLLTGERERARMLPRRSFTTTAKAPANRSSR